MMQINFLITLILVCIEFCDCLSLSKTMISNNSQSVLETGNKAKVQSSDKSVETSQITLDSSRKSHSNSVKPPTPNINFTAPSTLIHIEDEETSLNSTMTKATLATNIKPKDDEHILTNKVENIININSSIATNNTEKVNKSQAIPKLSTPNTPLENLPASSDRDSPVANLETTIHTKHISNDKKETNIRENQKDTSNRTEKGFGDLDDDKNSHFFAYLLTLMLFAIFFYLVFHNKKRIIAMIIEGRNENNRTRNRARYHKLDNNLEEAMNRNYSEVY